MSEFSDSCGQYLQLTERYCKLCDSKVGSDRKYSTFYNTLTQLKYKAAIKSKQNQNKFVLQKTQQQLLSNTKRSLL